MIEPAIYEGWVRHRRGEPVHNAFRYGTYLSYFDLEVAERGALPSRLQRRFRREDHAGEVGTSLTETIREAVRQETGKHPEGPIALLTHLRQGGYVFNPVSFFYVWRSDLSGLEAVVAEVHNTPWGETHLYVVPMTGTTSKVRFTKKFHVSPFMGMDQEYVWTISQPSHRLAVHMANLESGKRVFDATLVLERRAYSATTLRRMSWRHPLATYGTIARIYFQALKLWAKGARYHPHPRKSAMARGAK